MTFALSQFPAATERPDVVVVADDDAQRREAIAAAMRRDGYSVREVASADQALRILDVVEPDLLLACEQIAGTSALELCSELRGREGGRHTPLVVYSGTGADEDAIARALFAGCDDFVASLDRTRELSARVRVQLRNRRVFNALARIRAERDTFRHEATTDPLTGVLNRRSLEEELRQRFARGLPFAVLFLDLDHFKSINDRFGHDAGDEVLRAVASRLKRGMRSNDCCGRWGGEEFVMLLSNVDAETSVAVAERHRRAIAAIELSRPDLPKHVSTSVGLAYFDGESDPTWERLVHRADLALYHAKQQGRNRVAVAAKPERPTGSDVPCSVVSVGAMATSVTPTEETTSNPPAKTALELQVEEKLGGRVALPVLPDVAAEALRVASNPNAEVAQLARLVERSPPIAARFLSVANSALYARGIKAASVHTAIVRVGLGAARDLLFQVAYETSLKGLKRFRTEVERSFRRGVLCAVAAKAASVVLKEGQSYAYLCGLLHDMGEARVYRILGNMPSPPTDVKLVTDLVRRYHTRAGAEVASLWRLPSEIVEVCASHHDDEAAASLPVRIVMISDTVVDYIDGRCALEAAEARLARLHFPAEQLQALVEATRAAAKSI